MTRVRNPQSDPLAGLGLTAQQYTDLRTAVTAWLTARSASQYVDADELRGVDARLTNSRVWNHLRSDMQLTD